MSDTPLVHLERMTAGHVEQTWRWLQDAALRRAIDCIEPPAREGNAAYWQAKFVDLSREDYAIVHRAAGHVGNAGLHSIDHARRKAELWIYLGTQRGQGIGASAVALLLRRGFGALDLNRIALRVLADNIPAQRLYAKFGFVEEGRGREDTVMEGAVVDAVWYGLLRRDYAQRQSVS